MTGSAFTPYSQLRDGEIDQLKAAFTAARFGANHVRDFLEDKEELREWLQDGIARLNHLWANHSSHIPHTAWEQVPGVDVWFSLDKDPHLSVDEYHDTLAILVRTYHPVSGGIQMDTVHFRHSKWKKVIDGVEMRR